MRPLGLSQQPILLCYGEPRCVTATVCHTRCVTTRCVTTRCMAGSSSRLAQGGCALVSSCCMTNPHRWPVGAFIISQPCSGAWAQRSCDLQGTGRSRSLHGRFPRAGPAPGSRGCCRLRRLGGRSAEALGSLLAAVWAPPWVPGNVPGDFPAQQLSQCASELAWRETAGTTEGATSRWARGRLSTFCRLLPGARLAPCWRPGLCHARGPSVPGRPCHDR